MSQEFLITAQWKQSVSGRRLIGSGCFRQCLITTQSLIFWALKLHFLCSLLKNSKVRFFFLLKRHWYHIHMYLYVYKKTHTKNQQLCWISSRFQKSDRNLARCELPTHFRVKLSDLYHEKHHHEYSASAKSSRFPHGLCDMSKEAWWVDHEGLSARFTNERLKPLRNLIVSCHRYGSL